MNVECVKCSGTGSLNWTRVDNGRCFDCDGSGKVDAGSLSESMANGVVMNATIALSCAADAYEKDGNTDYVTYMVARAAKNLAKVGTERARAALWSLVMEGRRGGHVDDEYTEVTARKIVRLVCEAGRKAKESV